MRIPLIMHGITIAIALIVTILLLLLGGLESAIIAIIAYSTARVWIIVPMGMTPVLIQLHDFTESSI